MASECQNEITKFIKTISEIKYISNFYALLHEIEYNKPRSSPLDKVVDIDSYLRNNSKYENTLKLKESFDNLPESINKICSREDMINSLSEIIDKKRIIYSSFPDKCEVGMHKLVNAIKLKQLDEIILAKNNLLNSDCGKEDMIKIIIGFII